MKSTKLFAFFSAGIVVGLLIGINPLAYSERTESIRKLNLYQYKKVWSGEEFEFSDANLVNANAEAIQLMVTKINQLVDAVNTLNTQVQSVNTDSLD